MLSYQQIKGFPLLFLAWLPNPYKFVKELKSITDDLLIIKI